MFFFPIILLIGTLTSFTDLKYKKIYNYHLLIGAVLGLLAIIYAGISRQPVLFHLINGLIAFIIGFMLHKSALWRGGDAKLFSLYALLMPAPLHNSFPLLSSASLFACSFLAGLIILLPVFIKDIVANHKVIIDDLLSPTALEVLLRGAGRLLLTSWIMFPFYYLALIANPIVMLYVMYLCFSWRITRNRKVGKHYVLDYFKRNSLLLPLAFILGLLMRVLLSPASLSPTALRRFIIINIISAALSFGINTTFNHFKHYHERVPFAPLLFIGCLLSYTTFLLTLMHMTSRWNMMLYR